MTQADLETPSSADNDNDGDSPQTPPQLAVARSDEGASPSPFTNSHHHRDSSGSSVSGSHRSSISSLRSISSGSTSAGVEGQVPADVAEGDLETPLHRRSVSDSTASPADGHSHRRRVKSEDGVGVEPITIRVTDEVEGDPNESGGDAWDSFQNAESSPKSVNSMSTSRVDSTDSSTPSSPMSPESGTRSEEHSQQLLQQKLRAHPRPVVKQQTGAPRQDWVVSSSLKTPESQDQESLAFQNSSRSVPQASQLYGGSQLWTGTGPDLQNASFFPQGKSSKR